MCVLSTSLALCAVSLQPVRVPKNAVPTNPEVTSRSIPDNSLPTLCPVISAEEFDRKEIGLLRRGENAWTNRFIRDGVHYALSWYVGTGAVVQRTECSTRAIEPESNEELEVLLELSAAAVAEVSEQQEGEDKEVPVKPD